MFGHKWFELICRCAATSGEFKFFKYLADYGRTLTADLPANTLRQALNVLAKNLPPKKEEPDIYAPGSLMRAVDALVSFNRPEVLPFIRKIALTSGRQHEIDEFVLASTEPFANVPYAAKWYCHLLAKLARDDELMELLKEDAPLFREEAFCVLKTCCYPPCLPGQLRHERNHPWFPRLWPIARKKVLTLLSSSSRAVQLSAIAYCDEMDVFEAQPILAELIRAGDPEVARRAGLVKENLSKVKSRLFERNESAILPYGQRGEEERNPFYSGKL
jgi:hypothetical protein